MDMMKLAGKVDRETSDPLEPPRGVTIKCYSPVGEVNGLGKLSIDAREVINLDTQHSTHFAALEVATSGDYPQEGVATIKYEDIEHVCNSLKYIRNIDPKSTKFKFIEADISQSDLRIVVFNTANGRMMAAVTVGSASIHLDIYKIDEVRRLLHKAKEIIDECRHM